MSERWLRVPGFGEYIVSSLGRVRHGRVNAPVLKGSIDKDGYRRVCLHRRTIRVHVIVAEAFHGPRPEGMECAHLDGNPQNNQADNLAWVTHQENVAHQSDHGTFTQPAMPGEAHPNAKLTEEDVAAIRHRVTDLRHSQREVARAFGIQQSQVSRICARKSWAGTASPSQGQSDA